MGIVHESDKVKDVELVFVEKSHTATDMIHSEDRIIKTLEPPVKEEGSDYCDLESKIEIEEDMIFKTESTDLSEFI